MIKIEFRKSFQGALKPPSLKGSPHERELRGAELYRKAASENKQILSLDCRQMDERSLDFVAGIYLASFRFDKYRTTLLEANPKEVIIVCDFPKKLEAIFSKKLGVLASVDFARKLTSEPPNCFPPRIYAETLLSLQELGLSVEILKKKDLQKLGMKALLAASQGSYEEAHVVILQWKGNSKRNLKPIALLGKGVNFDSGGLCLKSKEMQQDMKWDKAGAGVVAGTMRALAVNQSDLHVIGIIGLLENMPGGGAIKPGDVIISHLGLSIEIVDTDAEGRLLLADLISFAKSNYSPRSIIDLGTLSKDTFASLGTAYAGLWSNDPSLSSSLIDAGNSVGELLWALPRGSSFAKQIESDVADLKNSGIDGWGECGAAAEFLSRFAGDIPWAHIDIAGVSWSREGKPLAPKGVTGFGVRLLYEWLERQK